VNPISEEEGNILAAKLLAYAGEPDEYYTFVTFEAYNALKEWRVLGLLMGNRLVVALG
jgi:hypothetical protein